MEKVIIFGASGFVGRHLVKVFQYKNPNLEICNIGRTTLPHVTNLNLDLEKELHLRTENSPQIDSLKESSAAVILTSAQDWSKRSLARNQKITSNILSTLLLLKPKKIILISSVSVYGELKPLIQLNLKQKFLTSPDTYYGRAKLKAENDFINFCSLHNIPLIILRPALIYGEASEGPLLKALNFSKKWKVLPIVTPFSVKKSWTSLSRLTNVIFEICKDKSNGIKIENIVDSSPTQVSEYLINAISPLIPKLKVIVVPHFILKFTIQILAMLRWAPTLEELRIHLIKANTSTQITNSEWMTSIVERTSS